MADSRWQDLAPTPSPVNGDSPLCHSAPSAFPLSAIPVPPPIRSIRSLNPLTAPATGQGILVVKAATHRQWRENSTKQPLPCYTLTKGFPLEWIHNDHLSTAESGLAGHISTEEAQACWMDFCSLQHQPPISYA